MQGTTATREYRAEGWCVRLDCSRQVLSLEIPEYVPGRGYDHRDRPEPVLASPPISDNQPVSVASVLLEGKLFDDGLVAAVALATQNGAGRFVGKAALLRSLAETLTMGLPESAGAAARVYAACKLGRVGIEAPDSLRGEVIDLTTAFLSNGWEGKPLGFYTWTAELSAIFRQDRFLQQQLEERIADALARTLDSCPALSSGFAACLRLNGRLTNPPARTGIHDPEGERAFLPGARSHEQILLEQLYGDTPIPAGFDLMSELIRRVRTREISFQPTDHSGWYDHQTWSLEPLLIPGQMPEGPKLDLGKRYLGYLEEVFRGVLALARETHVKQACTGSGGYAGLRERPLFVPPGLSVEPLPSLYSRRAASYRFVRSILDEAFGPEAVAEMRRLTEQGSSSRSLADELTDLERLFDGAAAAARHELGMQPQPGDEAVRRHFGSWRRKIAEDRERDVRMMVPVFFDRVRKRMKVWALLGWQAVPVDAYFSTEPTVLSVGPDATTRNPHDDHSGGTPPIRFTSARYHFAMPVMAEVYVSKMLNRAEFRRLCDRHRTRQGILANLR